ncbi:MAG: hypothetical protein S4CHLAM102_07900 [Chlamydiia bacterium]|nr:hypothetical protein [Chlamydiia bacterium]
MRKITKKADVIIVGMGLSGITAAHVLKKRGLSVALLEAEGEIGGRACQFNLPNIPVKYGEERIDAGAVLVREGDKRYFELCKQFGIDLFEDVQFEKHNQISHIPSLSKEMRKKIAKLELVKEEEDRPLREWVLENGNGINDLLAINGYLFRISMFNIDQITLNQFIFLNRSRRKVKGKKFRVRDGVGRLAVKMAEQIGSPSIFYHALVKQIEKKKNTFLVSTDDQVFEGKVVILATGPSQRKHIEFDPPVLPQFDVQSEREYGVVFIEYLEKWWGNKHVRSVLPYQIDDKEFFPLIIDGGSQLPGREYLLRMRVPGNFFSYYKDWKKQVKSILAEAFPDREEVEEVLQIFAYDWSAKSSSGGYLQLPTNGFDQVFNQKVGDRIFQVGAEYSDGYFGTCEGAIRSALDVVDDVARQVKSG